MSDSRTEWLVSLLVLPALLVSLLGCQTSAGDLARLATEPALPYSVLVTGGAFVLPATDDGAPPRRRTFRSATPKTELFPLANVVEKLERARVFERVQTDDSPVLERWQVATATLPVFASSEDLAVFLQRAQAQGHDLLLILQRIDDGPVESRGINGQWPLTAAVWLLIGLGALIPDHTYESSASLHLSLRDTRTGRVLYDRVLNGGAIDLALTQRVGFFGLLTSIVIPPFWVRDDATEVEATVAGITAERLVDSIARQLKTVDALARLQDRVPATLTGVRSGDALNLRIEASEGVSFVRVFVDGVLIQGADFEASERRLLGSVSFSRTGRVLYEGALAPLTEGRFVQVVAQTLTGQLASITIRWDS